MTNERQDVERLLGPLGAEAMEVLWAADRPIAVREVLEALNQHRTQPLAYTTVMTILTRLADKGILERTRHGKGYRYEPLVPDAAAIAVRDVLRAFGDTAVSHFIDHARADPDTRARLRKLLEEP